MAKALMTHPELWNAMRNRVTDSGATFAQCIKPGRDSYSFLVVRQHHPTVWREPPAEVAGACLVLPLLAFLLSLRL